MITRWFTSFRIFLVWLLGFALVLIILALGHELLMMLIINTLKAGRYIVRLVYMIYYTIAGLVCVAYYIFVHDFLSKTASKGRLLKSSLLILGTQVLLICLIHLGLLLYSYFPKDKFGIFLFVIEGLTGAIMLSIALHRKNKTKISR